MNKWVKRLLVVFGAVAGVYIVFLVLVVVVPAVYQRLGRITDFVPLADGAALAGTPYVIHITPPVSTDKISRYDLWLENPSNNQTFFISKLGSCFPYCPAELTVLNIQNQMYWITKVESGGSNDAFIFNVYNVTGSTPLGVGLTNDNPTGLFESCVYPKFEDGQQLEFEIANYCSFYPIFDRQGMYSYIVPLV